MHAGQSIYTKISMIKFELALENDRWLNITEFVKFCSDHENQDITIDVINEGHCLRYCGVYDILEKFNFSSVKIHTSNALEDHPFYLIERRWDIWLKNIRFFDNNFDYTWNQKKIFGCFYNRPSAPRLGIAGHLLRYHKNDSLIVTRFFFNKEQARETFDINRLFTWSAGSLENLHLLDNQEYLNLYPDDSKKEITSFTLQKGWQKLAMELAYRYKNIMIDIVSEPSCAGDAFYPTEKIVRSILCKRPFIVMANKNYLLYLRQLGFQTFYDFWDEDYDGFAQKLRYLKILDLIDTIGKLDKPSLGKQIKDMDSILNHNYDLLVSQQYKKQVIKLEEHY
jgi:hypothetical protein